MRLLLDSHALIWWLSGDLRLSERAREALSDASREVYVSAASAWEIATKHRIGKLPDVLDLVENFSATLQRQGLRPMAVSLAHGLLAGRLQVPHKDPFDRMLIAQALVEGLVIVSNERAFDAFGVSRLW